MIKKVFILILLISLSGCTKPTNVLPATLSIEGRVLVNEKLNNEDFLVQIYKENSNEVIANSSLGHNGEFKVNIIEDGNYVMTTASTNGNDYKGNKISFTTEDNKLISKVDFNLIISDEPVQLTSSISIDPVLIKGTVNFPDGMNYVDIKVMLSDNEGGRPLKIFMVDQFGEFKISDIQDGIYYICAVSPDNKESSWLKVEVVDNKVVGEEKNILELK